MPTLSRPVRQAPLVFDPMLLELVRQALSFVLALSGLAPQVCKAETMAKAL